MIDIFPYFVISAHKIQSGRHLLSPRSHGSIMINRQTTKTSLIRKQFVINPQFIELVYFSGRCLRLLIRKSHWGIFLPKKYNQTRQIRLAIIIPQTPNFTWILYLCVWRHSLYMHGCQSVACGVACGDNLIIPASTKHVVMCILSQPIPWCNDTRTFSETHQQIYQQMYYTTTILSHYS